MSVFVLDCSITMGWCFEDEKSAQGEAFLESLKEEKKTCLVPDLWSIEVVNVLTIAERHQRLTMAEAIHFLDLLANLPITIDETPQDFKNLLLLSKTYGLSTYDAAYLDLAIREQIPLATQDKKLRSAANQARIPLAD